MIERVRHEHPRDPAGFTLATLSRVAHEAAREWTVRQWAGRLAARAKPHDYRGQLRHLFADLVTRRWRYVQEPDEYVHGNARSLVAHVLGAGYNQGPSCPEPLRCDVIGARKWVRGWGDCDDVSALLAAGVMALGLRVRWRIARSPRSAHIAVEAQLPNGERVDLDPVAYPTPGHGVAGELPGFAWAVNGPDIRVEYRELQGGDGIMMGAIERRGRRTTTTTRPSARPRRPNEDRGCHWCAVSANDRRGPRILAVPGWHAKQFGRGVVVEGTPAADQFGQHYVYHAGLDLFVPESGAPLGSRASRRAHRKERRIKRRRRVRRFFKRVGAGLKKFGRGVVRVVKKVGAVARKIGAVVLSSKIVQRIIGGALRVVGIPALLTRTLLAAIGGIMKEGGIIKLIKLARKDPRAALRAIARAVSSVGRFDLLKKIKGAFSGISAGDDGGPVLLQQDGAAFYGAPVAAMIGFDGILPLGEIAVADRPTAGRWYRAKPGEAFLEIVGKAYGLPAGAARLERSQWVAEADANAAQSAAPQTDFERKYYPDGVPKLRPVWACDPGDAIKGAAGKCFPLLWFPPARGIEPPPIVDAANDDGSEQGQWDVPDESPGDGQPVPLPPDVDDGPDVVEVPPDADDEPQLPPAPPMEPTPAPEYAIAARPTPGARYRVKKGDTLLAIAGRAIGVGAGAARLAYAQQIAAMPANAGAIRPPANDFERTNFPAGLPTLTPKFSCDDGGASRGESGGCLPMLYLPAIGVQPGPGPGPGPDPRKPVDPRAPENKPAAGGGGMGWVALLLLPLLAAG